MKNKLIYSIFIVLLCSCSSYKKDFNQFLPEQDREHKSIKESTKDFVDNSEFVDGKMEQEDLIFSEKLTGKNHMFTNDTSDPKLLKPAQKTSNQHPAGVLKQDGNYIIHNNAETVYKLRNDGDYSIGFLYFKDSYDYDDPTGNFVRTYENSTGSIKGGFLQVQFEKFLTRKYIDFSVGMNAGLGYNNGRGIFLDGNFTESETKFNLWTLPLDFTLAIDIPLTSWVKISAYGGPSFMGLIQSRDDRDHEDDDKIQRQMSFGYFYGAKFRFSLTNVFKKTSIRLYDQFEITRYFFTIDSRIQKYSGFKDSLTISGASIGVGFTFEYL
ncbi:MAG: hypothetical protein HN576_04750 [Bacteriovoracaceae bacterium]|nr:hypothetical protein [Bacteriovoracaceae bacterium]